MSRETKSDEHAHKESESHFFELLNSHYANQIDRLEKDVIQFLLEHKYHSFQGVMLESLRTHYLYPRIDFTVLFPSEIVLYILSYLDLSSLLRCSLLNHALRHFALDDSLWINWCRRLHLIPRKHISNSFSSLLPSGINSFYSLFVSEAQIRKTWPTGSFSLSYLPLFFSFPAEDLIFHSHERWGIVFSSSLCYLIDKTSPGNRVYDLSLDSPSSKEPKDQTPPGGAVNMNKRTFSSVALGQRRILAASSNGRSKRIIQHSPTIIRLFDLNENAMETDGGKAQQERFTQLCEWRLDELLSLENSIDTTKNAQKDIVVVWSLCVDEDTCSVFAVIDSMHIGVELIELRYDPYNMTESPRIVRRINLYDVIMAALSPEVDKSNSSSFSSSSPVQVPTAATSVHVTNIPINCTDQSLLDTLSKSYGTVRRLKMRFEPSTPGFASAFVEFRDPESVVRATDATQTVSIAGNALRCTALPPALQRQLFHSDTLPPAAPVAGDCVFGAHYVKITRTHLAVIRVEAVTELRNSGLGKALVFDHRNYSTPRLVFTTPLSVGLLSQRALLMNERLIATCVSAPRHEGVFNFQVWEIATGKELISVPRMPRVPVVLVTNVGPSQDCVAMSFGVGADELYFTSVPSVVIERERSPDVMMIWKLKIHAKEADTDATIINLRKGLTRRDLPVLAECDYRNFPRIGTAESRWGYFTMTNRVGTQQVAQGRPQLFPPHPVLLPRTAQGLPNQLPLHHQHPQANAQQQINHPLPGNLTPQQRQALRNFAQQQWRAPQPGGQNPAGVRLVVRPNPAINQPPLQFVVNGAQGAPPNVNGPLGTPLFFPPVHMATPQHAPRTTTAATNNNNANNVNNTNASTTQNRDQTDTDTDTTTHPKEEALD